MIELEGCDAVLGAQWLRTLGLILWNFGSMEMGFKVGENEVRLIGLGHSEVKKIGLIGVYKTLKKSEGKGMLLQIKLIEGVEENPGEWEPWIERYPSIFGEIKGLPPKRNYDHQIPLLPGSVMN